MEPFIFTFLLIGIGAEIADNVIDVPKEKVVERVEVVRPLPSLEQVRENYFHIRTAGKSTTVRVSP